MGLTKDYYIPLVWLTRLTEFNTIGTSTNGGNKRVETKKNT